MVRLESLPDETLHEILSYLPTEKRMFCQHDADLCNMALQSRRFSALVRPILVRDMDLNMDILRRITLFSRSIEENPTLASKVYSLKIYRQWAGEEEHAKVNQLLGKLDHLSVLDIRATIEQIPFQPTFLRSDAMKHLTTLTIFDDQLTPICLAHYFFHESMRSINLMWLKERSVIPTLPEGYKKGTSPITNLTMNPYFHLREEVLLEILGWPRDLQLLSCGQTGIDRPWQETGEKQDVSTPFSPASMTKVLTPVRHTLQRLVLHAGWCDLKAIQYSGEHDGSTLDLSSMLALRVLDIHFCWVFPSFNKRQGFYKLLPPKLESLQLHLGYPGSGITRQCVPFETGEEIELCNLSPDLSWLMEVVLKKKQAFPGLKAIQLEEYNDKNALDKIHHRVPWIPPTVIALTLKDAEITLVANVLRKFTRAEIWQKRMGKWHSSEVEEWYSDERDNPPP